MLQQIALSYYSVLLEYGFMVMNCIGTVEVILSDCHDTSAGTTENLTKLFACQAGYVVAAHSLQL